MLYPLYAILYNRIEYTGYGKTELTKTTPFLFQSPVELARLVHKGAFLHLLKHKSVNIVLTGHVLNCPCKGILCNAVLSALFVVLDHP